MSESGPYFRAGGTMDPGAASYIEREADHELLAALLAGEYIFLLDSRQKGKSSLVARTIVKLKDAGVHPVKLDLQRIGANVTPEQWYAGMLAAIGQELEITGALFAYWESHQAVGPLARWIGALEEVAMKVVPEPIVIFIDEVDFVRALPFPTDEFFAGIRDCYNRRSESKEFERLTFCLVGVATPGQLIRNPEITPFNIGRRIEISDFTLAETRGYGDVLDSGGKDGGRLISRVHYWLNGHPYLTQLLCRHITEVDHVRSPHDVDELVKRLFLTPEARQREPNFSDVERRLLDPDVPGLSPEEKRTQVLELYGRVLKGKPVEVAGENPVVATLRLSGVGMEDRRALRLRNRLYAIVFDEKWRRSSLPDAELRRQSGAARVAMLRTATVAGVILIAVSTGAFEFLKLSNDRQKALSRLKVQSDSLQKTSDDRRTALEKLEDRNRDLNRVSRERERALNELQRRNKELSNATSQRERALSDLRRSSDELTYSSYLGHMAAVRFDLQTSRYTRLLHVVRSTKDSPHRDWEWGHLAMGTSYGVREEQFPKWSSLELQPKGEPLIVTSNEVYSIDKSPARVVQKLPHRTYNAPSYRRGPYRVKHVENPRGHEIDDVATGRTLVPAQNYSMVYDIDAARGQYLRATGVTLDVVELRTIAGDRLLCAYKGPSDSNAARILKDGTILGSFQSDKADVGEIRRWDPSGKTLSTAPTDQQYAKGIVLSPDGRSYVAWGHNNKAEVRSVETHQKSGTLLQQLRPITALDFSPDGKQILTGSEDASMRLFDLETGKVLAICIGFQKALVSVAFIRNGRGLVGIDSAGILRLWETVPARHVDQIQEPGFQAIFGAFGDDGETLIIYSDNNEALSRNMRTGKTRRKTFDSKSANNVVQVFDGISALYVGRADGRLDRFDGATLRKTVSARVFDQKVASIHQIPGKPRLLVGSIGKKFALVDARTLRVLSRIEPKLTQKPIDAAGVNIEDKFAFDQEQLQFAMFLGETRRIHLYSSETGSAIADWAPGRTVQAISFVNKGQEMSMSLGAAWWVQDGETWIVEPKTGKRIHEFRHPGQTIGSFQYAPRTGILAAATHDRNLSDRVIFLYDIRTRQKTAEVSTSPYINSYSFYFSPNGERLLTWAGDNLNHVWDSRTGEEVYRLTMRGRPAWVDHGRRILQSGGYTIRIWSSVNWENSALESGQARGINRNSK